MKRRLAFALTSSSLLVAGFQYALRPAFAATKVFNVRIQKKGNPGTFMRVQIDDRDGGVNVWWLREQNTSFGELLPILDTEQFVGQPGTAPLELQISPAGRIILRGFGLFSPPSPNETGDAEVRIPGQAPEADWMWRLISSS